MLQASDHIFMMLVFKDKLESVDEYINPKSKFIPVNSFTFQCEVHWIRYIKPVASIYFTALLEPYSPQNVKFKKHIIFNT